MTLNQTDFPDGFYTSAKPAWFNVAVNFVDFGWFLALLAWLLVLFVWALHPRRTAARGWTWTPWAAGAGVLWPLLSVASVTIVSNDLNRSFYPAFDLAAGAVGFGLAVALWTIRLGLATTRHRVFVGLLFLACAAGTLWRDTEFLSGAWMLSAVLASGALAVMTQPAATTASRTALAALALLPFASTLSPLAAHTFTLRRYSPATFMTTFEWVALTLTALVTLTGLLRDALAQLSPAERTALRRDARPYLLTASGLLLLGLTLAATLGHRNRTGQIAQSLGRMHSTVAGLDLALVERCLGPELHLDHRDTLTGRWFTHPIARPKHLAGGLARPLAARLRETFQAQSGGVSLVTLVTFCDGWLVAAVSSDVRPIPTNGRMVYRPVDYVTLGRPLTPADHRAWAERAEYVEGPHPVGGNSYDYFRTPLVTRDGRMLGWLQFTWISVTHNYAAFNVRFACFAFTLLGLGATGIIFQQRRAQRQHAAAGRTAEVAAESARLKSAFLANVSHELRTPLQTIRGYAELLPREFPAGPARAELDALRRESDRLLDMVNDLLDLGAVEAGAATFEHRPFPLRAWFTQLVDSFQPRARAASTTLRAELAAHIPEWIHFDPDRLRQIVRPLLDHALLAGPPHEIVVALAVAEQLGPACRLRLTLTATGANAPAPADLRLALVTALVQRAGGTLQHTAPLPGTHYSELTLVAAITTAPPTPPPASLRHRRLLIADDNPLVRELFAAHLGELGATCDTATDGEAALTLARTGRHDALVLDLAMPGRDGLDVARTLRAEGHRALRIVGVSAHASGGDRATALAAGMDAFLTKPVELAALAAALTDDAPLAAPAAPSTQLQDRLAALFRADAAPQTAAVARALGARDWTTLHAAAHYLKGSASVIRDEDLYAACTALEEAATQQDLTAAEAAWRRTQVTLAPWLAAKPPSPTP